MSFKVFVVIFTFNFWGILHDIYRIYDLFIQAPEMQWIKQHLKGFSTQKW